MSMSSSLYRFARKGLPCAAAAAPWLSLEGHLWVWLLIADSLCALAIAGTLPAHHGNPRPEKSTVNSSTTLTTVNIKEAVCPHC